jgi:hypothetical protein
MNDRKIERILHLAGHFEQLLFTEVHNDRTFCPSRPMPDRLGQGHHVDFLYFLSDGH